MARNFSFTATLENGTTIGFSNFLRNGFQSVIFKTPDGKRREKSTGSKKTDANFHQQAEKIIREAYTPTTTSTTSTTGIGWDDIEKRLHEIKRRPATIKAYRKAIAMLRETIDTKTPNDITPDKAEQFAELYQRGTYTRSNQSDAKHFDRTPSTFNFYRRTLSAVWEKLKIKPFQLKLTNVWEAVPQLDEEQKETVAPTDEHITTFRTYLHTRYPLWHRLHLIVELKLTTGSRTADIVQLETRQLAPDQIRFEGQQTKTNQARTVPLTPEFVERLKQHAGKKYLWEGWIDDCAKFRPSKNKLPETFQTKTVEAVLANIFREFSDTHPQYPRLSPHDTRAYRINQLLRSGADAYTVAVAIGLRFATAEKHYIDFHQQESTRKVFAANPLPSMPEPKKPEHLPNSQGDENSTLNPH